jgi:hypothetical protein
MFDVHQFLFFDQTGFFLARGRALLKHQFQGFFYRLDWPLAVKGGAEH